MNPIANHPSFSPFSRGVFAGGGSFQAEQTRAGSVTQNQSTDLTITTDDGDTVTLSLDSSMTATAGVYRSLSMDGDTVQSSQTAFFEFSDSQELSIEINGDLDAEEMADIREAIAVIGGMIDDFLSGDLRDVADDGASLEDLDSIASLKAGFSYERQVMYGEQDTVEISHTVPDGRHHGQGRGNGRLHRLMDRIDRLTDDMAERVKGFGDRRDGLARSVSDLLSRYESGEVANAPTDPLSKAAIHATQSLFTQKLDMMNESSGFDFVYRA
jgi:hypothetical protein